MDNKNQKINLWLQISAWSIVAILIAGKFWLTKVQTPANTIPAIVSPKITYNDPAPVAKRFYDPVTYPANSKTLQIPILMYHHVGYLTPEADAITKDLTVSPTDFEIQVKFIKEKGFTSISLANVYAATQGQFTLPSKPIVFTFDDGYQDVFDNALPLLHQYGFNGATAIITQYAGHPGYASWADIKIAQLGGTEIVSHTQNHFDPLEPTNKLTHNYTPEQMEANLVASIKDIQDNLGITTNILVYPYGHYSPEYIDLVRQAGFVMGLTVHHGNRVNPDDLFHIPRIRVHGNQNMQKFAEFLGETYP